MYFRVNLRSIIFSFFFLLLASTLIFVKPAFADTFSLSGTVQDSSGNAISGATVSINDTNSDFTTTDETSGAYTFSVIPQGVYNIQVTPPAGSNFSPAIALNQNISNNTTLNFVLTPVGTVTLSGHIFGPLGNSLQNQKVVLISAGGLQTTTTTDFSGSYFLQVSSGTYTLQISSSNNDPSLNIPKQYLIEVPNYSLFQSMSGVDITLPMKKVDIHVQESSGSSVGGVAIAGFVPGDAFTSNLSIGSNITNARCLSKYVTPNLPQTDGSGNVTLWLCPSGPASLYTFSATPPSGGNYLPFSQSNISITNDTQKTFILAQTVTLSGHILGSQGNFLPNQTVSLLSPGGLQTTTTTDFSGNYSLQVSAGTYTLKISANDNDASLNAPKKYLIEVPNYSLSQSLSNVDITLPAKRVDVHVQDALGVSVDDIIITAFVPGGAETSNLNIGSGITNAVGFSTYTTPNPPQTDGSGNVTLWLFPSGSASLYTFSATPPSGGNYLPFSQSNVSITSDTQKTFTLLQTVTLSGHIFGPLGNSLQNQKVVLISAGGLQTTTTTDFSGSYFLQVSSGTYTLQISSSNNDPSLNIPKQYLIEVPNYSLFQSMSGVDITLPMKKVDIHVQESSGSSVGGVAIAGFVPGDAFTSNLSIGSNITNARCLSKYVTPNLPQTDGSGNVTLWLCPSGPASLYTFSATPPSGSIYSVFTLNNISVSGDQTEIISLQYNHAVPTTTIDLQTQHQDGTYSNPTTVTLTATADTGYTIANTYYKVDGGSTQTYSVPFSVTGAGDHSIEYWSIDNSGVQETHHTKNFTIYQNLAPYVDPLSDSQINQGATYSATGSFSDSDSSSWTATVDYDEGAGYENLPLNPDKTFTLSHQYQTAGTHTVTVVVTDNQGATGTTMATITVNAPAQIIGLSATEINYQDDFIESGSLIDPDSSSWTATVDYGDSSGAQNLTFNGTNFSLNHTYFSTGTYTVLVTVTDNQGATSTATIIVKVNAPPHISQLLGATIDEGATYTESGSFSDPDSTNWTATVNYGEGGGLEPLSLNPDKTFVLNHLYKDNLPNNAQYIVTLTITDNHGAVSTRIIGVTVNNVKPKVGVITVSVNPVQVNTQITATATFTDDGVLDTHTSAWQWNDGQTTTCPATNCTITESNGSGTIVATHTYTTADVYEINLTVTDKDGGIGHAPPFQYLSVYNPTNQGLFTGVTKFQSPAGALIASPSLTGQVKFGVSSGYTGSNATGDADMNFSTGDFKFVSDTVSSLVITSGKATLTGTGSVNGVRGYTYLITGLNGTGGGQGFIRYQIKNSSNVVVYDTQPGAPGNANPTTPVIGQIIVH